ncbi:MAG: ABC transporter permease subunit, partial [Parvibaculaceae bacterium]
MTGLGDTSRIGALRRRFLLALPVIALSATPAWADEPANVLIVLWKWIPLLMSGFLLNIVMSVIAMAIGTVGGVCLGICQLSPRRIVALPAWAATHFFRNAPWLVVLFFIMFLIPFRFTLFGQTIPFPDWIKATVGLSIPVIANISEVTRGALLSIPNGQWESASALGLSRLQAFLLVILPQC